MSEIRISKLTKYYGDTLALNGIDLSAPRDPSRPPPLLFCVGLGAGALPSYRPNQRRQNLSPRYSQYL